MGALCCVATGPHGSKSNTSSRDCSMGPSEPHWCMNSGFSPPLSRRWECRLQSDGLSHRVHEAPIYGSSLSSHSKGSRARPETSVFSESDERRSTVGNNYGSASPLSDSCRWASTGKQPSFFPPCNFSGRRSFMSKPVYPLVFQNPFLDTEAFGMAESSSGVRATPVDDVSSHPMWPENILSPDLKFQEILAELQKMEASPEPNTSSRREGFRWSNVSSYDFGNDGEMIDITDHISVDNQRCLDNSARYQKCGLCWRLLRQKSPWSSNRIVRSSDMPIAGVLPCHHVFHAHCLEEITPKSRIHEPPCPLCLKAVGNEGSARRIQGVNISSSSAGN